MERLTAVGHDARVERRRHGQAHGRQALRLELRRYGFDGIDGTGQNDLSRCVVIRDDDAGVGIEKRRDRLGIG